MEGDETEYEVLFPLRDFLMVISDGFEELYGKKPKNICRIIDYVEEYLTDYIQMEMIKEERTKIRYS